MAGVSTVVGGLSKVAGAASGLAAAFGVGVGGLTGALTEGLQLGGRMADLSRRTGEAVRDLVSLERAFELAGISGQASAEKIDRVNVAFEKHRDTLRGYGLDVAALANAPVTAKLEALAGLFARIESPAQRTAVAMRLFGASGGEILQLLRSPGDIRAAAQETEALGYALQKQAEEMDRVGDALSLLKTRWQEVVVQGTSAVLPMLDAVGRSIKAMGPGGSTAVATGGISLGIIALANRFGPNMVESLNKKMLEWADKKGPGIGTALGKSIGHAMAGRFAPVFAGTLKVALVAAITYALAQGYNAAQQATSERLAREAAASGKRYDKVGTVGSIVELQQMRDILRGDLGAATVLRDELRTTSSKVLDILSGDFTHEAQLSIAEGRVIELKAALSRLDREGAEIVDRNQRAAEEARERAQAAMRLPIAMHDVDFWRGEAASIDKRLPQAAQDQERRYALERQGQGLDTVQTELRARQRNEGLYLYEQDGSQNPSLVTDPEKLRRALEIEQQITAAHRERVAIDRELEQIDSGRFGTEMATFWKGVADQADSGHIAAVGVQQAFDGLTGSISDALTGVKSLGQGMKEVGRQIIAELIAMTVRAVVFKAIMGSGLGGILGLPAGGASAGTSSVSTGGFAGARAAGGPVLAGRTYMVGERGAEVFTPSANGAIIPNHRLGGITVNITQNYQSGVSPQDLAQLVPALEERTRVGVLDAIRRSEDGFGAT